MKKELNVLFLMLDLKNLKVFILCLHLLLVNKGTSLLKKYDTKSLYPCFKQVITICAFWLSPKLILLTKELTNTKTWIFEMVIITIELAKELVNKELLIFRQYQDDVENIKCHFQWWEKYDSMFFIIEFLASQISWRCWLTK